MQKILLLISFGILFISSAFAQKKSDNDRYITEMNKRYKIFLDKGESDSILYLGLEFIDYAEEWGSNDELLLLAYNLMGNAYATRSDHANMLEYYLKALSLAEKMNDKERIALIAGNISFAYVEIENYEQAMAYANKSIETLQQLTDEEKNKTKKFNLIYGDAENSIGESFLNMNKNDSALIHLTNAYNLVIQVKDSADFNKTFIITNLARCYAQLNEKNMAENLFKQGMEISTNIPLAASRLMYYYGLFLYKEGRLKEAKKIALMGVKMGKKSEFKKSVIQIAQLLQDIYAASSRTDSAFYYSRMMNAYKDSVFNSQSQLAVQSLTFKREIEEKNDLQKKQELADRRTHNIQLSMIAIAIFTLIILFLLLSRTIIVQPRVIKFLSVLVLLIAFEFINLIVHPTLEKITNHSPLLMLLGLVLVAAVIVPFHHRLEKGMFKKVVEKNKEIRLAAAKKIIQELEGGNEETDKNE